MEERILYKFDGFHVDPMRRSLEHDGVLKPLTSKAFDLLLVFVQNQGINLSRSELIKLVWSEASVTDNNFSVTLNAARKALGESGGKHRYIIKVPNGYRFVAEVRIVALETDQHSRGDTRPFNRLHVIVSCSLLAALYGAAVFLEIAYQFDRYGRPAYIVAALACGWILASSVAALTIDRQRVYRGKSDGLRITILIFFIAAALLFAGLTRFLPNEQITQAAFQTYPAPAAYLKDTVYFLALALLFLIIPFHFITAMNHEIHEQRYRSARDTLTGKRLSVLPRGTIYLRFGHLAFVLLILAVMSIAMTAHLLDNLQPGAYRNLFTQLVYLRGILYFGLAAECLAWYRLALNEIKRQCLENGR